MTTALRLNPSQRKVLDLLRQGPVTTHDFIQAGAGSRFGARIGELRSFGFEIAVRQFKGGASYRLARDVERAAGSLGSPAAGRSLSIRDEAALERHLDLRHDHARGDLG